MENASEMASIEQQFFEGKKRASDPEKQQYVTKLGKSFCNDL
jgi:hypothetical protein